MWTEAEIKQYLDGNFWFFDHEGRLHHKPVLHDYIPDHNGKAAFASYGNLAAVNSSRQVDWPANAVEIIRDMRLDDISWADIGDVFGCSGVSAGKFYRRQMRKIAMEQKDNEAGYDGTNR